MKINSESCSCRRSLDNGDMCEKRWWPDESRIKLCAERYTDRRDTDGTDIFKNHSDFAQVENILSEKVENGVTQNKFHFTPTWRDSTAFKQTLASSFLFAFAWI